MGKYDKFVDIDQSPDTRNNWRLAIEELKDRAKAMTRMISYAAAKEVYDSILADIPGGADYAELKKSLKLVEVSGTKDGEEAAYAIYVNPKGRRIRKMDAGRTIITIIAKRGRTPPPDDVVFLEEKGPWTVDTIPFWPNKSQAIVTQRKSSKKQVDDLRKKLKKQQQDFEHELLEAGRRVDLSKPNGPGRIKANAKAVPDLAMQALSLEFGDEGVRSKPVFRKAITSTKRDIRGLAKRYVEITDAMTDPNSKKYKNWPPRIDKISSGTAATFRGFQKRLGF